jgi:hypothetical protein
MTVLCLALALPWSAGNKAEAQEIGDAIEPVLATDIQAYVNDQPIPSMNVMGFTAVAAEDLRRYGFEVAWIPQEHRLEIQSCTDKPMEPLPVAQTTEAPGTKFSDVLYTDIETFYDHTKISSYNIGGRTAVLLNDLEPFGQVVWSENERELRFTAAPAAEEGAEADRPEQSPLILRQSESVTIEGIAFGDEEIRYEDEVVGKIVNDRPLISVTWMAEQFGYTMEKSTDGYYVYIGSYGFVIHPGEQTIERFWFGAPAGDNELYLTPIESDGGDLLAYETDLKRLFGYYSVWEPESRTLNIDYRRYWVEDYGLPDRLDQYFYSVTLDSYISGIGAEPSVWVKNRINGGRTISGGSSGGSVPDSGDNEPNYRVKSGVAVDFGHNDLEVMVAIDWRILFYKAISTDLSLEQVGAIVDYSRQPFGFGDYTLLKSITPERAYYRTTSDTFEAAGAISSAVGGGLTFQVEVQDGDTYRAVSEQVVPFDQDRFGAKLTLPDEPGLYRITAISLVTHPRGTSTAVVAKWYVEKVKD